MNPFADIPLHPAVVHVPLGLAFAIPALVLWSAFRAWRGDQGRALWGVVAFLQVVLVAGAFVAMSLGEKDEEAVERVVAEEKINAHEARAKQFAWGGVAAFVITSLLLGTSGGVLRLLSLAAVLLSLATAGLAVRAGHSGGQLVYVHGAASAHVEAPGGAPPTGAASETQERDDDD